MLALFLCDDGHLSQLIMGDELTPFFAGISPSSRMADEQRPESVHAIVAARAVAVAYRNGSVKMAAFGQTNHRRELCPPDGKSSIQKNLS